MCVVAVYKRVNSTLNSICIDKLTIWHTVIVSKYACWHHLESTGKNCLRCFFFMNSSSTFSLAILRAEFLSFHMSCVHSFRCWCYAIKCYKSYTETCSHPLQCIFSICFDFCCAKMSTFPWRLHDTKIKRRIEKCNIGLLWWVSSETTKIKTKSVNILIYSTYHDYLVQ